MNHWFHFGAASVGDPRGGCLGAGNACELCEESSP